MQLQQPHVISQNHLFSTWSWMSRLFGPIEKSAKNSFQTTQDKYEPRIQIQNGSK